MAEPEDVAGVVALTSGNDASYFTGQSILDRQRARDDPTPLSVGGSLAVDGKRGARDERCRFRLFKRAHTVYLSMGIGTALAVEYAGACHVRRPCISPETPSIPCSTQ